MKQEVLEEVVQMLLSGELWGKLWEVYWPQRPSTLTEIAVKLGNGAFTAALKETAVEVVVGDKRLTGVLARQYIRLARDAGIPYEAAYPEGAETTLKEAFVSGFNRPPTQTAAPKTGGRGRKPKEGNAGAADLAAIAAQLGFAPQQEVVFEPAVVKPAEGPSRLEYFRGELTAEASEQLNAALREKGLTFTGAAPRALWSRWGDWSPVSKEQVFAHLLEA